MQVFLDSIRTPDKNMNIKNKVINTSLIFLLGAVLGVFSKWLDNLSIDDTVLWQRILGELDLRNVFSDIGIWLFIALAVSVFSKTPQRAALNVFLFFAGMTVSYHLYTIYFSGFNPMRYMMIWYAITIVSPALASVCWYAKSESKISTLISSLILCVMLMSSFVVGIWYFDFKSVIDLLIFIGAVLALYVNPKNTVFSLAVAFVFVFAVSGVNYIL